MRILVLVTLAGCGGQVSSDAEAELAWLGLDRGVDRALDLGLAGFNAASSANIDDQTGNGDIHGTMTVGGQVDQGASDNKGLRLEVTLVDYQDLLDVDTDDDADASIAYATNDHGPAALDLQLRGIPDGTWSGTLVGDFDMAGDLEGVVSLNLTLDGTLADDGAGGTKRATSHVTGTATSGAGSFTVDVPR